MEQASKHITRKPRKSQSDPFAVAFTRSNSLSGRARTDPFRHHSLISKRPGIRRLIASSTSPDIDFANEEAWSRPSVKDLRSRRVFSPPSSIAGECGLFIVNGKVTKCPDQMQKADSEEAMAMDVEEHGFVGLEKVDCQKIESQQTLMDGSKRDDYPGEGLAGDFGIPLLDRDILPGDVSDGNGSNLMSTKQDSDALQPFGSQNYASITACSPTSLVDVCCSKSLVNEGNEKIEIRVFGNNGNLNESILDQDTTMVDSDFSCHSTGKESAGNEYIQRTDAQHVNETRHNSSLIVEKLRAEDNDVEICQRSGDLVQTEACHAKAFGIDHPCEDINANSLIPDLVDAKEKGEICDEEPKADDSNDVSDEIVDSNIGSLHKTEPDGNIVGKTEGYEDVGDRMKCPLHGANQVLEKTLPGSADRDNFSNIANSVNCSPKRKLGLNPCSRLRLFKIPSSFNYKRLLPYLRDLNNDNSGASESRLGPGPEKYPKQKPLSTLSTSDSQKIPFNKLYGKSELHTPEMKLWTASNHVADGDRPNIESSEHRGETAVSLVARKPVEGMFNEVRQPEAAPNMVNLLNERRLKTLPLSPLVGHKSAGGETPNRVLLKLSVDEREKSIAKSTPTARPTEGGIFSENSFQLEASCFRQISGCSPQKSILKRHPRGCRGICTCLKCASFHLHAERAFEFSKNQMQDFEEVASDLIMELSHLRGILEKAAPRSNQDTVFCISQVKEACRKASEVEELAKTRLEQMNCDLSIHCRIECGQRPRMRFAKNFEPKVIP